MRRRLFRGWLVGLGAVALVGCKTTCPDCAKRQAALATTNLHGEECARSKQCQGQPDCAAKPAPSNNNLAQSKPHASSAPKETVLAPSIPMLPVVGLPSAMPAVPDLVLPPNIEPPTLVAAPAVSAPPAPAIVVVEPSRSTNPQHSDPQRPSEVSILDPVVIKAPTPAAGKFAKAPNYQWLRGEVTYSSVKKVWRLRYAPLGEGDTDAYGGSVTLTGSADLLDSLQDGQTVHVDGELLQRTPSIAPLYRVGSLKVVE